jgi:hypothetical protein
MDDPKKKGADGKRRSQQSWEVDYQQRKTAPKKKAEKKVATKTTTATQK